MNRSPLGLYTEKRQSSNKPCHEDDITPPTFNQPIEACNAYKAAANQDGAVHELFESMHKLIHNHMKTRLGLEADQTEDRKLNRAYLLSSTHIHHRPTHSH